MQLNAGLVENTLAVLSSFQKGWRLSAAAGGVAWERVAASLAIDLSLLLVQGLLCV